MMTDHRKQSSTTSTSRSHTVSSISIPSEPESPDAKSQPLRRSYSGEKRFSLDGYGDQTDVDDVEEPENDGDESPGTLPDSVYDAQMAGWRSAVRRTLKRSLKHESRILGAIQV
jgi:hypothetical protein